MSQREFYSWLKYRRKVGSLDMGYRLDKATALLCYVVAQGKVDPEKFMPSYDEQEEAKTNFGAVFAGLKSKAKPKAKA